MITFLTISVSLLITRSVYGGEPVDFRVTAYYLLCITVVFCSVHDDSVGAETLAVLPCRRAADKDLCFE